MSNTVRSLQDVALQSSRLLKAWAGVAFGLSISQLPAASQYSEGIPRVLGVNSVVLMSIALPLSLLALSKRLRVAVRSADHIPR
jgi:hypothetical protein